MVDLSGRGRPNELEGKKEEKGDMAVTQAFQTNDAIEVRSSPRVSEQATNYPLIGAQCAANGVRPS